MLGYYAFDASTPIVDGTWDAALAAARCAMTAAALVIEGEAAAYALCRPPGHHAGRSSFGGYCYLNNAALAAQYLLDEGCRRVSVIDVDYHHGNGTQEIFWSVTTCSSCPCTARRTPSIPGSWAMRTSAARAAAKAIRSTCRCRREAAGTSTRTRSARRSTPSGATRRTRSSCRSASTRLRPTRSARSSSRAPHYPLIGRLPGRPRLPTVLVQEGGYAVAEIGINVAGVIGAFAGASGLD